MKKRYSSLTDNDAVVMAHRDLREAPDYATRPLLPQLPDESANDYMRRRDDYELNFSCKMDASDLLLEVSKRNPCLIYDGIIQDCMSVFPSCNAGTQITIIKLFAQLKRKDTLSFLETVSNDNTRVNAYKPVLEDGKFKLVSFRDEKLGDWVYEEAIKAIKLISIATS